MEIRRRGNVDPERARKFECVKCDAMVLAKRKEASTYDGVWLTFKCPLCNYNNLITAKTWEEGPLHDIIQP